MIAAGVDWKKITEFIGHSDVRTTYNRYGKVVPEDLAPAAAQLEEYFDRGRARLESRPQCWEQDWWWHRDGRQAATRHQRVTTSAESIRLAAVSQESRAAASEGGGAPRLKLEIVPLSVEMKEPATRPERRPQRASRSTSFKCSGTPQISPRNWGQGWGHFGGSMTGFRLPPAAPSG